MCLEKIDSNKRSYFVTYPTEFTIYLFTTHFTWWTKNLILLDFFSILFCGVFYVYVH